MILPSDDNYQETKRLKRSGAPLKSPFKEIAEWIAAEYRVRILNVVYDTVTYDRPRLIVILETQKDALKLQDGASGDFNKIDQRRVHERFETILAEQDDHRFNVEGLFVIFAAFEPVARMEANESVTKEELDRLKLKLNNKDLWEISRLFESVTFFFYTDAQVRKYEAAGLRDLYADEYARLLQAYDEFGYFQKRGVSANFDSKENFDTNYQSNWYYYYK
ncbi:MAG TPA: hypothetical protein VLA67_03910 [Nitrospiraceae bacterium]|nr:hypothetical protein [Nitrospiraceae bacterium]